MRKLAGINYLLCLGFCSFILSCGQTSEVQSSQVRVVWNESPATRAVIAWTTIEATEQASLAVSQFKDDLSSGTAPIITAFESGQYNSSFLFQNNENPYYHLVKLEGLQPATKYYFRINQPDKDSESEIYSFRTAPDQGDFSLLVGGDSRSDQYMRLKMNHTMLAHWQEDEQILALLHGGDYVEDGRVFGQWSQWLEDNQLIRKEDGELLPIIPTRGNHEDDPTLYNQIFGYPGVNQDAYFKMVIADSTFLVLNTEVSMSGEQMVWLEEQLKASQDSRWLIPNYHTPAFPVVKRPGGNRQLWVPLFEKYGADLVFESDGHAFKKTAPIFQEAIDHERGIIYLGEGGLGVKQRSPKTDRWFLQDSGVAMKKHHVMKLTVREEYLNIEAISEDADVFLEFETYQRRP